jgi:hypothetical protein
MSDLRIVTAADVASAAAHIADMSAGAVPLPVVTAVHTRPNCVLVYGPVVSEGGRRL